MSEPVPKDPPVFNEEELAMLRYFWGRGDLECYAGWDALLPVLERSHPEIPAAWRAYVIARRTLTAVLDGARV